MIQKIINVGNSLAVVLPKQFTKEAKYRAGDTIDVETNAVLRAAYVRPIADATMPGLTPEFKQWLDEISEKEADIIKALARV